MNSAIENLRTVTDYIFSEFRVSKDYFISVKDEYNWEIISDDNINLIKWYEDNEVKTNLIVSNNSGPLIISKDGYTMIIAIDCVKIAYIFKDELKR